MRLIRTKIYRAFPELDRFDDARCERFIQAARRAWGLRLVVLVLCIIVGFAVIAVPPAMIALTVQVVGTPFSISGDTVYMTYVGASLIAIIAAPVAGFLTRDALLRKRIRYVLRARGVCLNCRYSLVGLPIGPDLMVTCPECQTVCEVDEAMGELSPAADGTSRYTPNPSNVAKPWFSETTRRRVRTLFRVVLPTMASIAAMAWGGYEFFLWRQAKAAIALKPGAAGLLAYAQTLQPAQEGNLDEDAWTLYTKARELQRKADARLAESSPPDVNGEQIVPDYAAVYGLAPAADTSAADLAVRRAQASEAERYLKGYGEQGLWQAFDELADARSGVIPLNLPAGSPAMTMLFPQLSEVQQSASMLTARMTVAARGGDGGQVVAAYRTLLALARMTQMQPVPLEYLYGIGIEILAQQCLRSLMLTCPEAFDVRTLQSILAAAREQQWTAPATHPWEGERLYNLDTVAWVFSSASNVRFGKFSPALRRRGGLFSSSSPGELPEGSLGTLAGVKAELDAIAAFKTNRATMTIADRYNSRDASGSSNLLISSMWASSEPVLRMRDTLQMVRNGTSAMVLIEQFRRENGRVPASLTEALGAENERALIDPFSGKPLLYKTIDSKSDRLQRPYVLYGVGSDLSDNGGRTPEGKDYRNYFALNNRATASLPAAPLDYIINDDR